MRFDDWSKLPCAWGHERDTTITTTPGARGGDDSQWFPSGEAALATFFEAIHNSDGRRKMLRDTDDHANCSWRRRAGGARAISSRSGRRVLERGFHFSTLQG